LTAEFTHEHALFIFRRLCTARTLIAIRLSKISNRPRITFFSARTSTLKLFRT